MFIGVCDYGSQTAGKDSNTLLQGAKNGALENSKSHLVSEKQITLGIYPGLTFEAESDQAHFSARIYFVGSTLYQALVVYPQGKPYADAARFLDSFQLIARVQAEKPAAWIQEPAGGVAGRTASTRQRCLSAALQASAISLSMHAQSPASSISCIPPASSRSFPSST
jgi:hypothetical protein